MLCEGKLLGAYLQNSAFLKCFGIELSVFMEAGIVSVNLRTFVKYEKGMLSGEAKYVMKNL